MPTEDPPLLLGGNVNVTTSVKCLVHITRSEPLLIEQAEFAPLVSGSSVLVTLVAELHIFEIDVTTSAFSTCGIL